MVTPDINPYAPPEGSPVEPELQRRSSVGSPTISLISAAGTVAFFAFTIVLLTSSPGDQMVGFAFLANGCLMIALSVSVYRSTRSGVLFGTAATVLQSAIMVVLLSLRGFDKEAVLLISAAVILPLLLITFSSWHLTRQRML